MVSNKSNQAIITAFNKGCRVDKDGNVCGVKIKSRRLYKDPKGYLSFGVKDKNRKTIKCYVHRLVAFQKYGYRMFEKGIEVRHLDGNRINNHPNNIKIGTHSQNMMDVPVEVRVKNALHATAKLRKLSKKQVEQLFIDRKNGAKYIELMKKYKIAKSTVSYILNSKTYKSR